MRTRIVLTSLLLVGYITAANLYGTMRGPIEAQAAVQQVQDSVIAYTFGQQMARGNLVPVAMLIVLLGGMLLLWARPIRQAIRGAGSRAGTGNRALALLFVAGALALVTACGPAKVLPLEQAGPNETVFVIPIEGDSTQQAKFESVKFLEEHKVLSKRIELPVRERTTGRMPWDYEYIPTVRVIKVDRQLVTREWTKGGTTGTSAKDEALSVASLDSINFHLGVNLTASILEADAPLYLYWHGQKSLADVVDTNVRGYLQGIMSDEFGKLRLEDAKSKKSEIFKKANDEAIEKFKKVGITISYVGSAQGFMFDDTGIQTKINQTQTQEMAVEVARKKNNEQTELNKAIVSLAIANRQAAEEFAKATAAQQAKIALDIEMVRAQAMLEAAKNLPNLKGQLPSVLPPGSSLLFGFDQAARTSQASQ